MPVADAGPELAVRDRAGVGDRTRPGALRLRSSPALQSDSVRSESASGLDSYTRESTQPSPVSAVSARLSLAFPPVWRYCGDLGKQVRSVSMGHAMESLSEPGDASSGREPVYNRDCALGEPSGADTSYPDTAYHVGPLRYCALRRGSGAPGPQEIIMRPSGGALDALSDQY